MLDRIRSDLRSEDPTTMVILGLSMTTIGGLTASGASNIGIGTVFGTVVLACGVLILAGMVALTLE